MPADPASVAMQPIYRGVRRRSTRPDRLSDSPDASTDGGLLREVDEAGRAIDLLLPASVRGRRALASAGGPEVSVPISRSGWTCLSITLVRSLRRSVLRTADPRGGQQAAADRSRRGPVGGRGGRRR